MKKEIARALFDPAFCWAYMLIMMLAVKLHDYTERGQIDWYVGYVILLPLCALAYFGISKTHDLRGSK